MKNKSKLFAQLALFAAISGINLSQDEINAKLPDELKQTPKDLERIELAKQRQFLKKLKRQKQREFDLNSTDYIPM